VGSLLFSQVVRLSPVRLVVLVHQKLAVVISKPVAETAQVFLLYDLGGRIVNNLLSAVDSLKGFA